LEIKRIGSVIGVKPDQIAEYERIHADVWPEVKMNGGMKFQRFFI